MAYVIVRRFTHSEKAKREFPGATDEAAVGYLSLLGSNPPETAIFQGERSARKFDTKEEAQEAFDKIFRPEDVVPIEQEWGTLHAPTIEGR